ncbi:hypothetical protein CBS101457_002197 [Exobasidium rhododendri]|nr:hypothetical protein CBS101457_002197 [Exobasidium rhododendri]
MAAATALPFDATASIWADIKPVYQDDGPSPVCPILYSPSYSQAMDLIRALLPADELSPRALALTEHLSQLCPSSYTIWHYRARILIHGPESGLNGLGNIETRLKDELNFLDELATKNMKNYQVWQHRKLIVSALGDPSRELSFVAQVLQIDSKNYHTWVYRQWVLSHFGGLPGKRLEDSSSLSSDQHSRRFPDLWKGELAFVDNLLKEDARNNSAWNHRYFCIFGSNWAKAEGASSKYQEWWNLGDTFPAIVQSEIAVAKSHIVTVPNNASAWNYLRGVAPFVVSDGKNPFSCAAQMAKTLVPSVEEAKRDPAVDAGGKTPFLALEWLLDDAQECSLRATGEQREEWMKIAEAYVSRLCIADPIRRKYWQYRLLNLRKGWTSLG